MQQDSNNPQVPALLHTDEAAEKPGRVAVSRDGTRIPADACDEGSLSRAMVHDLRNAVAPIRNAVYLLQIRSREDPSLVQITDMIDRQVKEIVRLLK